MVDAQIAGIESELWSAKDFTEDVPEAAIIPAVPASIPALALRAYAKAEDRGMYG